MAQARGALAERTNLGRGRPFVRFALALGGCIGLAVVLATAWIGILSVLSLWAIATLAVLIVLMAVRDP